MALFDFPDWATDTVNNGSNNTPNKVTPGPAKIAAGWGFPEKPPRGEFNYWMNLVGLWIRHLLAPKYVIQVTTYTAEAGDRILPQNLAAIVTINLPATPTEGDTVYFRQIRNQLFSLFALTIGRNGSTIMGLAEDMTVGLAGDESLDDIEFEMYFNGTTWTVNLTKIVGVNP